MYAVLISNGVRVSQDIWQMKLLMKIKIFMWYLKRGVILTKITWLGEIGLETKTCRVCHFLEIIQHLFFYCFYAKFLWRSIHILFGISSPMNINDLFVHWSKVGNKKYNTLLLTAATALLWAIWLTRNEVVLNKCKHKSFLQVLFRGTHRLRQWAKLQRHDDRKDKMISVAQHLETSTLEFFGSNGWLSQRHVGFI
jgi:hypothetical protein